MSRLRADTPSRRRRAWWLLALVPLVAVVSLSIAVAAAPSGTSPPANDNFASATPVGVDGVIAGTTAGAGRQPGEPDAVSGDRTVWFAWTPTAPGQAFVVPVGAGVPVLVTAYTGAAIRHLVRVDHADPGGDHVLAVVDALPGVIYWLRVETTTGPAGAFHLQIVLPAAGAPVNATQTSPSPLGQAVRSAVRGHAAAAISGTTAGSPGHAAWYAWTAPAGTRGSLHIALPGSPPARLALFAGAGPAPRHLQSAGPQGLTVRVAAGATYLLRVSGEDVYFRLSLAPRPGFVLDTTPPTVSCRRPAGWLNTNAAVRCAIADAGSGVARRALTLTTTVPAGTASSSASTNSVRVCDRAGNCATAGPVTGLQIDLAPPTVNCDPVAAHGWAISVTTDCTTRPVAGGAPLAKAKDRSFTLTATLPLGQASAKAAFAAHAPVCDVAGNCAKVPVPSTVAIDHVPPAITCATPRAGGWISAAAIRCTASDAQSGLADAGDAVFQLTTTVGAGASSATAFTSVRRICDKAGNCATAGPIGPLHVDREPPVITCRIPRGWQRAAALRVPCTARDTGSGPALVSFGLAARVGPAAEGVVSTATRRLCDRAGNCITAGPLTVALDDKPPTVSCNAPPRGLRAGGVTIACAASDDGSGVAPGQQVVMVHATLPAGRGAASVPFTRARVCDRVGNCTLTPALRLRRG